MVSLFSSFAFFVLISDRLSGRALVVPRGAGRGTRPASCFGLDDSCKYIRLVMKCPARPNSWGRYAWLRPDFGVLVQTHVLFRFAAYIRRPTGPATVHALTEIVSERGILECCTLLQGVLTGHVSHGRDRTYLSSFRWRLRTMTRIPPPLYHSYRPSDYGSYVSPYPSVADLH